MIARLRRFVRSRYTHIGLGVLVILAFVWWVVPRPIRRVGSLDGGHAWNADQAPTRRQVLWQLPQPIADLLPDAGGSFITPRLTDNGATLYFTYLPPNGHADIYRARFQDGQWQRAESVKELNGESHDIGPALSHDGRQLFFYSDRPGGHGGFDLYVSERTASGWGKPRNLGPEVNSPAHEYDPALAPDGTALYFASNRTAGMTKSADADVPGGKGWAATLRGHPGLSKFSLYVSQRDSPEQGWGIPESLPDLNVKDSNQGAPFVSPSGTFLYFASDRPVRSGEKANLDLFRARRSGNRFVEVENLGPGINTSAHETEPALSPEGFTLVFSSDREGTHHLYRSTAEEVVARTDWDTRNLQVVAAVWWKVLLLVLVLGGLFALAWHSQGWLLAKAPIVRFMAASLMVHCLLVVLLGSIGLGTAIISEAKELRAALDAPPIERETEPQPRFAKVDDKLTIEATVVTGPGRRLDIPAVVPEPAELEPRPAPLAPGHIVPPGRVRQIPMTDPVPLLRPVEEMERRSQADPTRLVEVKPVAPELPPALAAPEVKPLDGPQIVRARKDAEVPPAPALELPARIGTGKVDRPTAIDLEPAKVTSPNVRVQAPDLPPIAARQPARIAEPAAPTEKIDFVTSRVPANPRPTPPAEPTTASLLPGRRDPGELLPRISLAPPDAPFGARIDKPAVATANLGESSRATAPTVRSLPDALPRRTARADGAVRAEEPPLFSLRKEEKRPDAVQRFGGTPASEAAVERGLDWLAAHQSGDGGWALDRFHLNCKHPRCIGEGRVNSDTGATALALLPFLGAGFTHQATNKHQQTVTRGVKWLVRRQRADGMLATNDYRPMYGHGLGSIVLCEAYALTRDAELRQPAQRALDFIVKSQNPGTGGWRYTPGEAGDTSVMGWQVMALKSGASAGLTVPESAFANARRWLASMESNKPAGGQFGYQAATPSPAMTAQGLLSLQLMGMRREDPRLLAGADYLLKNLPNRAGETSYYWYHATQVMYHLQGKYWKAWNETVRDHLVATQVKTGPMAGTWALADAREVTGGRIYSTCLRLLMLEVYYRHLPLYQQLEK